MQNVEWLSSRNQCLDEMWAPVQEMKKGIDTFLFIYLLLLLFMFLDKMKHLVPNVYFVYFGEINYAGKKRFIMNK